MKNRIFYTLSLLLFILVGEYFSSKYGRDIFNIFYSIPNLKLQIWSNDTFYHIEKEDTYPLLSSKYNFTDSEGNNIYVNKITGYYYNKDYFIVKVNFNDYIIFRNKLETSNIIFNNSKYQKKGINFYDPPLIIVLWKPIGILTLSIYFFNCIIWISHFLKLLFTKLFQT